MLPPSPTSLFPSLEIADNDAILSLTEIRRLLAIVLQGVQVDEAWYLSRYPDVAEEVRRGALASAREHYLNFGYLERRVPHRPEADEAWYEDRYPDVAKAITDGVYPSAFEHFVCDGYRESRAPVPEAVPDAAPFSGPPPPAKAPAITKFSRAHSADKLERAQSSGRRRRN